MSTGPDILRFLILVKIIVINLDINNQNYSLL